MSFSRSEQEDFFASLHTSKGVYKQPKINVNHIIDNGEELLLRFQSKKKRIETKAPSSQATTLIDETAKAETKIEIPKSDSTIQMPSQISSEQETVAMNESNELDATVVDFSSPTELEVEAPASTRTNDPEFPNKLKEALSFLQQGLPDKTIMKVMIPYAINILKPGEGKEELWFDAINFDGKSLQVILNQIPDKVKYLKPGSTIKPALDKIEQFTFFES